MKKILLMLFAFGLMSACAHKKAQPASQFWAAERDCDPNEFACEEF